jgi:hypothetical protein
MLLKCQKNKISPLSSSKETLKKEPITLPTSTTSKLYNNQVIQLSHQYNSNQPIHYTYSTQVEQQDHLKAFTEIMEEPLLFCIMLSKISITSIKEMDFFVPVT